MNPMQEDAKRLAWHRTIPFRAHYSIREAAAVLGVTVGQVYGYINRQIVPAIKIEGVIALAHPQVLFLHGRRVRRLQRYPRNVAPLFVITAPPLVEGIPAPLLAKVVKTTKGG